jgi:hypothetical protein
MWISATSAGMTVFMHPRVSLNILMLSLSKYEVVVLVLRQAQDEGSVCRRSSVRHGRTCSGHPRRGVRFGDSRD